LEIFKTIEGYPDYEVSNLGNVKSFKRSNPKILKQEKIHGYKYSTIYNGNGRKIHRVHRLVLAAFVGPCPEGMECCHNNGIKTDNRLENLRWDTSKNNNADKINHGSKLFGENSPHVKLNTFDVTFIKKRLSEKWSCGDLGRMFKVHPSTIESIKKGRTWKHI